MAGAQKLSGGSGAPGWTLEAAGLDPRKFRKTYAAIVENTWGRAGDPYPMMIWPSNYGKYACATMFTLFFGGNTYAGAPPTPRTVPCRQALARHCPRARAHRRRFAPNARAPGSSESLQDYLQGHYLRAMQHLAAAIRREVDVVGAWIRRAL